jgi:hypothetical protein
MLFRAVAALSLMALTGPAGAALIVDEVENFENLPVGAVGGRLLASAEVRDAIVAAATARQWKIDYVHAGVLIGRLNVGGKHLAEVNILYSPAQYSVVYRDSINLNYRASDSTIHPSYNRWVGQLVDAINRSLAKPPRAMQEPPPAAPLRLN